METEVAGGSTISPNKRSILHNLNFIFTYLLSFVLFFAGISKLVDPASLVITLSSVFSFFTESIIVVIASILPLLELGMVTRNSVLTLIAFLLFIFNRHREYLTKSN